MALKAMICPQCQAQLEPTDEDMERGWAECPACGTMVQLREVKKVDIHQTVEHTGQVEYVNTQQAKNRLTLANRAYASNNINEAYTYYTQVLEDSPNDVTALYRKALCSVYMAPSLNNLRVPEFSTNLSMANRILNDRLSKLSQGPDKDQEAELEIKKLFQQIGSDVNDMLVSLTKNRTYYMEQQRSLEACQNQARQWCELIKLYQAAAAGVSANVYKAKILSGGIAFCDKVSGIQIRYFAGYAKVSKDITRERFKKYKLSGTQASQINEARSKLAEEYNELPGIRAKGQHLDSEFNALKEEQTNLNVSMSSDEVKLKESIKQFWHDNPDLKKKRNLRQGLPWISVLVGFILLIVFIGALKLTAVGIIVFVVCLALPFFLRVILVRTFESAVLPENIKALRQNLKETNKKLADKEEELKTKQKEISDFESEAKK